MDPLHEPSRPSDTWFGTPGIYLLLAAGAAAAGILQDRRDPPLQLGLLILAGFLVLSSVVVRLARR
jgi:hypothetical protein